MQKIGRWWIWEWQPFEGIGLRYLRNPDMDFDAICEVLAERIYMPREKLKQRLKELEAKQA